MSFKRKTIRGSAGALQQELNRLLAAGLLHEVWNLGTTSDPDDIELNLELNTVASPPTSIGMQYMVLSAYSTRIDQIENELRAQKKYMSTPLRMPLQGDKERSVALIIKAQ